MKLSLFSKTNSLTQSVNTDCVRLLLLNKSNSLPIKKLDKITKSLSTITDKTLPRSDKVG